MNFPFELDTFQQEAIASIDKGNNVLVMAHTGSGKTVIAVYAIYRNLREFPDKKVLFVSPIKSLSNEKFKDFTEQFPNNSVGILTGDNKINPDAEIIVITAEILRNDFFMNKRLVNNISCVVFDEVHYINDQDRGTVWEEILVMIDKSVQLVMLSATISKPTEFSGWLKRIKDRDIDLITTKCRIIPLTHYVFQPQEDTGRLYKILDNDDKFNDIEYLECVKSQHKYKYTPGSKIIKLVNFLKERNLLQTIVFSFSRAKCEQYANTVDISLVAPEESAEIERIFSYQLRNFKDKYEQLGQYHEILRLMKKGIAYHHSGLVPVLKEIVEIIFKRGLVKLLFATETFAVGVNMPTRTVVMTDVSKMTNRGKRNLNTSEYKQISGRAGRRGIDTVGNVIILPIYELPDKDVLKKVMIGPLPHIQSKFGLNYHFLLKSIRASVEVSSIFNDTLMSKEHTEGVILFKQRIEKCTEELSKIDITSANESLPFDKFDQLIEFEETLSSVTTFKMSLDKKQEKQYKLLKQQIRNDKTMNQKYQNYQRHKELLKEYNFNKQKLDDICSYLNTMTAPMIQFLYTNSYLSEVLPITELTSTHVTLKGNAGVYINECNFILLTEIINDGVLDDLCAEEVVAVIAVFIEDKEESYTDLQEADLTNNIKNSVKTVKEYSHKLLHDESSIVDRSDEDYWSISTSFVEVAYMWARQFCVGEIKSKIDIYEGNFIRNITKINNIVKEILNSVEVLNKIELIPVLQKIEPMLIRDIVTVNSLYIG